MKTSLIIPCRNAARWIRHAVESAARQTRPPHEIIVVDDGSTDDSVAQVSALSAHCTSLQLLRTSAQNAAHARNLGIEAATGDWIALLDADDAWYPNHLERAADLLDRSADVAYMANHDWMNVRGQVVPIPAGFRCSLPGTASGLSQDDFVRVLADGLHFGHSTVIYRRDRLLEVGGFDTSQRRRHDVDLWLRVVQGRTWAYQAEKAAAYREDTPGSISKNLVDAEYYYLRALIKNRQGFRHPAMERLIRVSARRAVSLAFVDGDVSAHEQARGLAWSYLPPAYRWAYTGAGAWPALLRGAIRAKRRMYWALARRADASPVVRHKTVAIANESELLSSVP